MAIEIDWYFEGRILQVTTSGVLTSDEMAEADTQIVQYLETVTVPLMHVLIDNHDEIANPGIRSYAQLKCARHPKIGWVVSYGSSNKLLLTIGSISAQILRLRYRHVATLDAALALLQERDVTLPDLQQL